uniref:Mlh1_C domain-containing protein n=1 Tax=Steinernema glaseri TaxID=37863 RepID=A0A1I7Y9V0_9BILA
MLPGTLDWVAAGFVSRLCKSRHLSSEDVRLDSPKKKNREEKEELKRGLDTHLTEEEEEEEEEEYDFGPAEKAGLSDDLISGLAQLCFEPIDWLTPAYESLVLKKSDDYQPKESEIFIRFKLPAICESEEFDLEAINRENADILEDLRAE